MNNTHAEKTDNVKTIRELLGMDEAAFEAPVAPETVAQAAPAPALDLPTVEWEDIKKEEAAAGHTELVIHEPEPVPAVGPEVEPVVVAKSKAAYFLSRDWIRYPLIFFVALGFFYLVLNFRGLSKQFVAFVNPLPTNEQAVLGDDEKAFNAWIKKYYIFVNDPEILAANSDPDEDGLTNMQEFKLGTNPLKKDTDRDGADDGSEVLAGNNPFYEGRMIESQRTLVAANINLSEVQQRRNFGGQVAGSSNENTNLPIDRFVLDPSRPGEVYIPKLGVDAPVVWSKTFAGMEEDLKSGTAHHPQTPYPGERGTSSIHGHSSGNWDDGDFKTVFTTISKLEPGDEVFVTVHSTAGESRRYRYLVRSKKVYAKTDPEQFVSRDGYFLNISTSWPVGTARERYVVTTELAGL